MFDYSVKFSSVCEISLKLLPILSFWIGIQFHLIFVPSKRSSSFFVWHSPVCQNNSNFLDRSVILVVKGKIQQWFLVDLSNYKTLFVIFIQIRDKTNKASRLTPHCAPRLMFQNGGQETMSSVSLNYLKGQTKYKTGVTCLRRGIMRSLLPNCWIPCAQVPSARARYLTMLDCVAVGAARGYGN